MFAGGQLAGWQARRGTPDHCAQIHASGTRASVFLPLFALPFPEISSTPPPYPAPDPQP